MGFLIDSDVLIAAERELFSLPELMADLSEEPLALAAITASELQHGVHRAQDASIRERRLRFVEFLLDLFPVVPFDLEVARARAALWASLSAQGHLIGAHDLLVAATAITLQFGRSLATITNLTACLALRCLILSSRAPTLSVP